MVPASLLVTATLSLGLVTPSAASGVAHARRVPGQTTWTGPAPSGPQQSRQRSLRPAWTSGNWSGYAITRSGMTSVVGNWTVPTVLPPHTRRQKASDLYSGTWVGIDGFLSSDNSLIQAGTEEDWLGGRTFYQAWWEILPAGETPIPSVSVHPGDSISVTITQGFPLWTITLTNNSTGQSFTTNQAYSGPSLSAEWIEEAVTVNGRISPMPHYSTFSFDNGKVNGAFISLNTSEAGAMVQGRRVSTPSAPGSDSTGFSVGYGRKSPTPPKS